MELTDAQKFYITKRELWIGRIERRRAETSDQKESLFNDDDAIRVLNSELAFPLLLRLK